MLRAIKTTQVMDGDRLIVTGKSNYFPVTFLLLLREQRIGEEVMEAILFEQDLGITPVLSLMVP